MGIHWMDEQNIEWALGVGSTLFEGSTMGRALEHAECFGYDSEGAVIPRAEPWVHMQIKKQRFNTSYMPDIRDMERFGDVHRVIRRMYASDRLNGTVNAEVLERYYGNMANRWAAQKIGRCGALYPLTDMGRKIIDMLKREPTQASIRISEEEAIANWIDRQERSPDDVNGARYKRLQMQADQLKLAMWDSWNQHKQMVLAG